MAAPAYTTDLTTLVDFDGIPASPSVAEPASVWTAGRSPVPNDTDYPIQSSNHASLTMNTTGKAGIVAVNSSFTWTSGQYMFGWITWLAPGAIDTYANGGLAMLLGSSVSVYNVYYVGGNNRPPNPYGGWYNYAVDPENTPSEAIGSPTQYYVCGAGGYVPTTSVGKGNPLGFDVFRYGRGSLRIAGGSSGEGYATFIGMASANDASAARWGLFQLTLGSYLWKGLMSFGYGSLTEFVGVNKNIIIDNTEWVAADFNRIEINNASSVIDWTSISITALGTVSKGEFEVIDNATVTLDSCTFTDMSTFIFQSNTTVTGTTLRRCGQVTQGGATFTGCTFDNSTAAIVLVVANAVATVTDTEFISDGTGYAMEGFSTAGDYSLTDLTFTGYAATDGVTGNEAIHVLATTGTVNLLRSGGTLPSIHTAGATVAFPSSVLLTVTVVNTINTKLDEVSVAIYASDDNAELMNEDTGTPNPTGEAVATYTGSTPRDIYVRVRESSGSPRYIPASTTGTIEANTGFSIKITLQEDTNA